MTLAELALSLPDDVFVSIRNSDSSVSIFSGLASLLFSHFKYGLKCIVESVKPVVGLCGNLYLSITIFKKEI